MGPNLNCVKSLADLCSQFQPTESFLPRVWQSNHAYTVSTQLSGAEGDPAGTNSRRQYLCSPPHSGNRAGRQHRVLQGRQLHRAALICLRPGLERLPGVAALAAADPRGFNGGDAGVITTKLQPF